MSGLDDLVKGIGGSGDGGLGDLLGGLAGGGSGGGLDDIVGALAGGEGTGARAGGMGGLLGSLLPAVGEMLAGGGLQQILAGFQANGRQAEADSWIGTGDNRPVSADDVRNAVGSEELGALAAKLGISARRGCRRPRPDPARRRRPRLARRPPRAGARARVGLRGARARGRHTGDRLRPVAPSAYGSRNSPRATVTACPPTSTRSIRPSLPSARA